MKVVINTCYGGFGISHEAILALADAKGIELEKTDGDGFQFYRLADNPNDCFTVYDYSRSDQDLVRIVQEMGEAAWGDYAELKIVEIPDDVEWEIDDYDGIETIHEKHRTWR